MARDYLFLSFDCGFCSLCAFISEEDESLFLVISARSYLSVVGFDEFRTNDVTGLIELRFDADLGLNSCLVFAVWRSASSVMLQFQFVRSGM